AGLGDGEAREVTEVGAEGQEIVAEGAVIGDWGVSEIKYGTPGGIVIGRLNAFEARETGGGQAAVEQLSFELSPHAGQAKMLVRGEQRGADVDIEGADVLVAGGRGLGKAENFSLCENLA